MKSNITFKGGKISASTIRDRQHAKDVTNAIRYYLAHNMNVRFAREICKKFETGTDWDFWEFVNAHPMQCFEHLTTLSKQH